MPGYDNSGALRGLDAWLTTPPDNEEDNPLRALLAARADLAAEEAQIAAEKERADAEQERADDHARLDAELRDNFSADLLAALDYRIEEHPFTEDGETFQRTVATFGDGEYLYRLYQTVWCGERYWALAQTADGFKQTFPRNDAYTQYTHDGELLDAINAHAEWTPPAEDAAPKRDMTRPRTDFDYVDHALQAKRATIYLLPDASTEHVLYYPSVRIRSYSESFILFDDLNARPPVQRLVPIHRIAEVQPLPDE